MNHISHYYTDADLELMLKNADEKLSSEKSGELDAKSVVLGFLHGDIRPGDRMDPTLDRCGKRIVEYKLTISNIRSARMKDESIMNGKAKAPEQKASSPIKESLYDGENASASVMMRECGDSTRIDVFVKLSRLQDPISFAYQMKTWKDKDGKALLVEKLRNGVKSLDLLSRFNVEVIFEDKVPKFVEFNADEYHDEIVRLCLLGVVPDLSTERVPLHLVKYADMAMLLRKLSAAKNALDEMHSGRFNKFEVQMKEGQCVCFYSHDEPKPEGNFLYLPKEAVGTQVYMIPVRDVAMVERTSPDVTSIYKTLYAKD